jgi:hypothetical protein
MLRDAIFFALGALAGTPLAYLLLRLRRNSQRRYHV